MQKRLFSSSRNRGINFRFPSENALLNKSVSLNSHKVKYVSQIWPPSGVVPPPAPAIKAKASSGKALGHEKAGPQ